ncbi:hypothetical protein OAA81_03280 [Flavobacteriaceae bacterium]|nr:hypothetical protein [Flavobacteriaceae bacterium]
MLLDFFRINLLYIENLPTLSIRTPYKIHTMTVRNWITKLLKASNKVEQTFYVSERDKGDYNNLHVHMLIGTNTDMTYKEINLASSITIFRLKKSKILLKVSM